MVIITKPNNLVFSTSLYVCEDGNYSGGLTKREYFAALALQGILSMHAIPGTHNRFEGSDFDAEKGAQMAVQYADALIAELNKSRETK